MKSLLPVVFLTTIVLAGCLYEPMVVERHNPNIIFILADDLGYGDISPFGQSRFNTPTLDRIAAEGMVFTQFYAGATVCAPSRGVLLTGKHTGHAQIRGNARVPSGEQTPLSSETVTLASMLHEAGYVTGLVGKWGLGAQGSEGAPNRQGFDYFFGYTDQRVAHDYYPEALWENETRYTLDNAGVLGSGGKGSVAGADPGTAYIHYIGREYAPYRMAAKVHDFIDQHKNQPFFLYFAPTIPHAALQVPDSELAPFDFKETGYSAGAGYTPHPRPRAARAAMISVLDRQVGAILDQLETLGLAANTLVIFTSDNGPTSAGGSDLAFFNSAGGFRGGKRKLTEGGIRVPTLARWPGVIKAESVSDHVSAFWDVMPTFADLAGITPPEGIDGVSFAPTLTGDGIQKRHESLYWEYHDNRGRGSAQAVRMGDWKGIRKLRAGRSMSSDAPIQLYDLTSDPSETIDVADDHPHIVERIAAIMATRTPSDHALWNFGD
ncbi:MAG: arylsulfatase [Pseudomonadota bacterium]